MYLLKILTVKKHEKYLYMEMICVDFINLIVMKVNKLILVLALIICLVHLVHTEKIKPKHVNNEEEDCNSIFYLRLSCC